MILRRFDHSIHTKVVNTEFDATKFKEDALSDHAGLFSEIRLSK